MRRVTRRTLIALGLYVLSFAARSLYAVDEAPLVYTQHQPGTRMATRYDEAALRMLDGDGLLFPRVIDPKRTGLIARPPGYPFLLQLIYRALGRSFFTVQLVQNLLNAAGPVLLFLVASALVGEVAASVAGLLAAISPHLCSGSNLIAADALSALPLLAACLVLAEPPPGETPRLFRCVAAGALLGLAVWLRPNASLLAPFLATVLSVTARHRWRAAPRLGALVVAAVLVVAPITIRNYWIFHELVPVSINGGLTLWEGVAEAGGEAYGARVMDLNVAEEEAERYGKPSYAAWWAEPDGIWRDRDRFRRSMEVIRSRPALYATAMLRRMASMVNYQAAEAPFVSAAVAESTPDAFEDAQALASRFAEAGGRAPGPRLPDRVALTPGRAAAFCRPVLGGLQRLAAVTTLPVCFLGIAVLLPASWRTAVFLAAIPGYYLLFESPFLREWRLETPMHFGIFALAGAGWIALGRLLRRLPARSA